MDAIDRISKYVGEVVANRGDSHGVAHMKRVANTAHNIANLSDISGRMYLLVMMTAWTHDVLDHKYEVADSARQALKEQLCICGLPENDAELVILAGERVSFSREVKLGECDWDVLGGDGRLVRDIVSDADKIDAIGKDGLDRCAAYIRESSDCDIWEKVRKHADEKLIKLYPNYIRTTVGREIAKPLHDEMIALLAK